MTVLFCLALLATPAAPAPPAQLTLDQAVARALAQHPALHASHAEEQAAAARAELSASAELPHADASLEAVVGTGNVLRGPLLPLREVPAITGPPQPAGFGDAALGSAASLGLGWDVLALRQRIAESDLALLQRDQSHAATEALQLRIAFRAADAFIAAQAAEEGVRVARAGVDRAEVLARSIGALAAQELKPGADLARAQSELALARTQLARAQERAARARARLAEALGAPSEPVAPEAGRLLQLPPEALRPAGATLHPDAAVAQAAVAAAAARERAVGLQYWPRLELLASIWVRGSGLSSGAVGPSPAGGLGPTTPNWSAGAVLSLPLFELAAIRAHAHEAAARSDASRWHRAEVEQAVAAEVEVAHAGLGAAAEAARNAAVARDAAQLCEQQASARYKAGLGSIVEIAEAERLRAQADAEEVEARLALWRARLDFYAAEGDLAPFLAEVTGAGGG